MKLNFKNLKKNALNIGLTAILASSSLAANEADAAAQPLKDADRVEMSIKDLKPLWAAQEKQLTPEQKNFWKEMTKDKRFKNILPRILEQLDITRIKKMSSGNIIVPFSGKEDVALTWRPGMNDFYVMTTKKSMVNNVISAHEMLPFMTDKLDCFFVPQPEDAKLSDSEIEIIQTLDKCLNEMYAFVYARGTADIDKKALMNGDYAGMVWDSHCTAVPSRGWDRLDLQEQKEYEKAFNSKRGSLFFYYKNIEDLKADYPSFTKKFSNQENEFYMSMGYPYSVKDLAEMGSKFSITGGCTGEMLMTSSFGSAQGVSWVYKPNAKMAEQTLYQFKERTLQGMEIFCKGKENGLKDRIFPKYGLDVNNLKNLTPFQKALLRRYETVKEYNKKIIHFVNKTSEVPKSLAHEGLLTRELQKNFNQLHTPEIIRTHDTSNKISAQKKITKRPEERVIK